MNSQLFRRVLVGDFPDFFLEIDYLPEKARQFFGRAEIKIKKLLVFFH
jgi:hypothetical protein